MKIHPDAEIRKLRIGAEQAPLVVIDRFAAEPDELLELASRKHFVRTMRYFPGVRAKAALGYQRFLLGELQQMLVDYFDLQATSLSFSMCHYSLVTTRPGDLEMVQRIPHIDSVQHNGLATVHYLFKGEFGGTAFYRHRQTGFEVVDETRRYEYRQALDRELNGEHSPPPAYINGDTPLFERIAAEDAAFNRILIYKRNSLHSGSIGANFVPDANPMTGRLSINSFIDAH